MSKNPLNALVQRLFGNHFMGIGLPKRDPNIAFLSVAWNKFSRPELSPAKQVEEWDANYGKPWAFFKVLLPHLKQLNGYQKLDADERYSHVNRALGYAVPVIDEIYYRFRRRGGSPDHWQRAETVDMAIDSTKELIKGLSVVFRQDYRLPNYRYAAIRPRIKLVAVRLFELTWILQHLCALRYRSMPTGYLAQVNKVFHVLMHYEDVLGEYALLSESNLRFELDRKLRDGGIQTKMTPLQLYIQVQVFSMIDPMTWRLGNLHVIADYLPSVIGGIQALVDEEDEQGELERGVCRVVYDQDLPPVKERAVATRDRPAYLIDFSPLLDHLDADVAESRNMMTSRQEKIPPMPPTHAHFNDTDRFLVLSRLREALLDRQQQAPARLYNAADTLHLLVGHALIHRFVLDKGRLSPEKFEDSYALALALSQGSAILTQMEDSQDEQEENPHGWKLADKTGGEGAKETVLKTMESDQGRSFAIGDMTAVADSADSLEALRLGVVSRLSRLADGSLELVIQTLANRFLPVSLSLGKRSALRWAGFLVMDKKGEESVILQRHPLMHEGQKVRIHLDGKRVDRQLGEARVMMSETESYPLMTVPS
ncbi:MAG: hypothetical protein HQL50_08045 [Magnetococcales bacterium]|nr:hypothetical protein [Magnetococcales bacterium]